VTLVRRDLTTGAETTAVTITDLYAEPRGLAWDGTALWLATHATGQSVIRRYATDGTLLATFAAPDWTTDLAWDGAHVVVANTWNEIEVLDPTTGAVVDAFTTPFEHSTQRGVTARDGQLWTTSWSNDDVAILDGEGAHVAVARVQTGDTDWGFESGVFLTFAGDRLVLAADDRVYLLAPIAVEVR
jgi:outer membrane protein assembly factor BamB